MAKKKVLSESALAENKGSYSKFLNKVGPVIEFLTVNLTDHIYKEDNILYPMAYETRRRANGKRCARSLTLSAIVVLPRQTLKRQKR